MKNIYTKKDFLSISLIKYIIDEVVKRIHTIPSAPKLSAAELIRSIDYSRDSASNLVYSSISPPTTL